jgi:hypothetical protein
VFVLPACLQLLLRPNGLTDLYLSRTASAMLGAQALVLAAVQQQQQQQGVSTDGSGSSWRLGAAGAAGGGGGGGLPDAVAGDAAVAGVKAAAGRRNKGKNAVGRRMQRQVSTHGSSASL